MCQYYSPCTTPVKEEVEDSDSPGESHSTQGNTELSGTLYVITCQFVSDSIGMANGKQHAYTSLVSL